MDIVAKMAALMTNENRDLVYLYVHWLSIQKITQISNYKKRVF